MAMTCKKLMSTIWRRHLVSCGKPGAITAVVLLQRSRVCDKFNEFENTKHLCFVLLTDFVGLHASSTESENVEFWRINDVLQKKWNLLNEKHSAEKKTDLSVSGHRLSDGRIRSH